MIRRGVIFDVDLVYKVVYYRLVEYLELPVTCSLVEHLTDYVQDEEFHGKVGRQLNSTIIHRTGTLRNLNTNLSTSLTGVTGSCNMKSDYKIG